MVFNYFKKILCDHVFMHDETAILPSQFFLGFSTTVPDVNGGSITEPTDTNYIRVPLDKLISKVDGIAQNEFEIEMNEALENWGTLVYSVLFDSISGGNALSGSPLTKSITIETGESMKIKVGAIKLYFGDATVTV